jgi:hypothetical protein
LAANEEFDFVFQQICAQLPARRTSRSKKNDSAKQDIYEWCEDAEKSSGAQIHWTGLIKQFKAKAQKKTAP